MSELEIYKGMVKKMKDDEIKEKKTKRIIEKIEGLATYVTIPRELAIYNVNIDSQEAKLLIDYITKLQQENERLRENDFLEKEHKYIEKISIPCKFIQNKSFEEIIEMPTYEDYKTRCEKAIEYIQKTKFCDNDECCILNETWFGKKLLNILNGRSDE